MSVAPVNIQLSSVPSTVSPSPAVATGTQAPSVSSSSSGNQSHTFPSNAPSTTTYNTTPSQFPTSGITASDARQWFRPPWRKIQRVCWTLVKVLFAIAGALVTYLALSTAMWSSAKDYRDDCRSQNNTYGHVSQACTKALDAVLSSPLGLSIFISEREKDRRHSLRKDQLPIYHASDDKALVVIAGICIIAFLLACLYLHLRPSARRGLVAGEPNLDSIFAQYSTTTYIAWVGLSVPKPGVILKFPSLGADPSSLRRRRTRKTCDSIQLNEQEECDWLPAGISTIDPESRQITGLLLETLDSPGSDEESVSDGDADLFAITDSARGPCSTRSESPEPLANGPYSDTDGEWLPCDLRIPKSNGALLPCQILNCRRTFVNQSELLIHVELRHQGTDGSSHEQDPDSVALKSTASAISSRVRSLQAYVLL